jgi:rhodanese-related sulfurtransferase
MLLATLLGVACAREPVKAPVAADPLKTALGTYFSRLPDDWGAIAPEALNIQIQAARPFIVEVREPKEIAGAGYIAGSINIPIRSLLKSLDKLPPRDQPIVVACGSGHYSVFGMEALQLLGYTRVRSLTGGFHAWKAANLPVETGTPSEPKAGRAPDVDPDLLAAIDAHLGKLLNGMTSISPATLKDLTATSSPFQLDVREPRELADSGLIAGSTNVPIRTLIEHLDTLPPDKGALIIAECADGHRSAMAIMALSLLGYTDVKGLAGGVAAWTQAKQPVSSPPS